jgi:hypothetical protein
MMRWRQTSEPNDGLWLNSLSQRGARLFVCVSRAVLLAIALQACGTHQVGSNLPSCPTDIEIPDGWTFTTEVDGKSYLYGGLPHFSAPAAMFGVEDVQSDRRDYDHVFVALMSCTSRTANRGALTPCGVVQQAREATERGAGFASLQGSIGSLEFGLRHFWPSDQSYLGDCHGVDFRTLEVTARATCTVWVPDASNEHGLHIVVAGALLEKVPEIVQSARPFLGQQYRSCVVE